MQFCKNRFTYIDVCRHLMSSLFLQNIFAKSAGMSFHRVSPAIRSRMRFCKNRFIYILMYAGISCEVATRRIPGFPGRTPAF